MVAITMFSENTGFLDLPSDPALKHSDDSADVPTFDTKRAMDNFEVSVTDMMNEVMMPSQLMDKTADHQLTKWATSSLGVPHSVAHSDLYAVYTMVKDMKNEMVKSISYKPHPSPDSFKNGLSKSASAASLSAISDSARSALTKSASTASLRAISEFNDSDSDSVSDSISEGYSSVDCDTYVSPDLVQEFTYHLAGLRHCLSQLSGAAELVTEASKRSNPDEC